MGYRVKQLVVHEVIANEMRSDAYGHVHAFFIDSSKLNLGPLLSNAGSIWRHLC